MSTEEIGSLIEKDAGLVSAGGIHWVLPLPRNSWANGWR